MSMRLVPAGVVRPDARVLRVVKARAKDFRPEFPGWLIDNWLIWLEFEKHSLAVARLRTHYSARTVAEFIRHNTVLAERGEFKLNNNITPDLARLFARLHPHLAAFFEFRSVPTAARYARRAA